MSIILGSNFKLNAQLPLRSGDTVADTTARDAIAAIERYEGRIIFVIADGKNYQLVGGITNSDWVEVGGSSTPGGAVGSIQYNNSGVLGGVGTIVEDADSLTITPTLNATPYDKGRNLILESGTPTTEGVGGDVFIKAHHSLTAGSWINGSDIYLIHDYANMNGTNREGRIYVISNAAGALTQSTIQIWNSVISGYQDNPGNEMGLTLASAPGYPGTNNSGKDLHLSIGARAGSGNNGSLIFSSTTRETVSGTSDVNMLNITLDDAGQGNPEITMIGMRPLLTRDGYNIVFSANEGYSSGATPQAGGSMIIGSGKGINGGEDGYIIHVHQVTDAGSPIGGLRFGYSQSDSTLSVTPAGSLFTPKVDQAGLDVFLLSGEGEASDIYTPAYLVGGSAAEGNYVAWTAITDGSFSLNVDHVQQYDLTSLNFTAATSMDDVAAIIQSSLRTATSGLETVVWDTDHFVISSVNTTKDSYISTLSSTGIGTDISGMGGSAWMDSESGRGTEVAAVFDTVGTGGKSGNLALFSNDASGTGNNISGDVLIGTGRPTGSANKGRIAVITDLATGTSGSGTYQDWRITNDAGNIIKAADLLVSWQSASAGSESTSIELTRRSNGSDISVLDISNNGIFWNIQDDAANALLIKNGSKNYFRVQSSPGIESVYLLDTQVNDCNQYVTQYQFVTTSDLYYWWLDAATAQGSGTYVGTKYGGKDLTVTGSIALETDVIGNSCAVDFDGSNDYLESTDAVFLTNDSFSAGIWAKRSDWTNNVNHTLMSCATATDGWKLYYNNGEIIAVGLNSSIVWQIKVDCTQFDPTKWYHIAVARDNNTKEQKLFINAEEMPYTYYEATGNNSNPDGTFKIGAAVTGTLKFTGQLQMPSIQFGQVWDENIVQEIYSRSAGFFNVETTKDSVIRMIGKEDNSIRTGIGRTMASANSLYLSMGAVTPISGTTTINQINVNGCTAGTIYMLYFTGAAELKHNHTADAGFGNMQLAGSVNMTAVNGAKIGFLFDGTSFQEIFRTFP